MMYLFQAHRLRAKTPPGQGLRLLSLERLEAMNRRAVYLSFPLLTAGVIAGDRPHRARQRVGRLGRPARPRHLRPVGRLRPAARPPLRPRTCAAGRSPS